MSEDDIEIEDTKKAILKALETLVEISNDKRERAVAELRDKYLEHVASAGEIEFIDQENTRDITKDVEINNNILQKIKETWTIEEVDFYFYYIVRPMVATPLYNNFRFNYIQQILKIIKEKEQEE
ncbi:MAG: hypothetical protein J6D03_11115 [Clostridia bacterium]|nr:hypothetical protein [Clostridia bacterium]HBC83896.1 hypothetical protein [Clostridiales bacterium]